MSFDFSSGPDFPEDLSPFSAVIHCGGCMLNEKEMSYRIRRAVAEGVPITNYGTAIAYMNGETDGKVDYDVLKEKFDEWYSNKIRNQL